VTGRERPDLQRSSMQYQPVAAPVKPFHEDENIYQFRFFCDKDLSAPIERNLPKSNPFHFCPCGVVIGVETDGEGPCLRFNSRPESHLAARLSQTFETVTETRDETESRCETEIRDETESRDEQMKTDDKLVSSPNVGTIRYALYALVALMVFGWLIFAVHMMS
jgi:hypothetical protein